MEARPEDSVETEPPNKQPLQLTTEELPVETEDKTPHPTSPTEEVDDSPAQTEDRTYVDADADVTEPEEHSLDPYDILRDDPFALIPPEIVERRDEKRLPPPPTHSPLIHRTPRKAMEPQTPNRGPQDLHHLPHHTFT